MANTSFSAARSTVDVPIGDQGGAKGDYLERVIVTTAVTTAALTISDGKGTVVCHFTSTQAAGTIAEVGCHAADGGFHIDLDAAGAGTVTCIGKFT